MIRHVILVTVLVVTCAVAVAQVPSSQAPGVVRTGNISPIIESLDRSLAFYETLLRLQVPPNRGGGPRPFFQNPGLHKMFGTTGATERHVDARIPGTTMGVEMIEFHDIDRNAVRPRLQDPGQVVLVLFVRDVDELLARLAAAGVPVRTPGGKAVPVRDGARAVLVEDPDGRPVELRQLASLPPSAGAGAGSDANWRSSTGRPSGSSTRTDRAPSRTGTGLPPGVRTGTPAAVRRESSASTSRTSSTITTCPGSCTRGRAPRRSTSWNSIISMPIDVPGIRASTCRSVAPVVPNIL